MRLENSYRGKTAKNTNTWRLNNILLNNQEITEEIKEKKKTRKMTMKTRWPNTHGMQQKQF